MLYEGIKAGVLVRYHRDDAHPLIGTVDDARKLHATIRLADERRLAAIPERVEAFPIGGLVTHVTNGRTVIGKIVSYVPDSLEAIRIQMLTEEQAVAESIVPLNTCKARTLADFMPPGYSGSSAYALRDIPMTDEYFIDAEQNLRWYPFPGVWTPWPGAQKHVQHWVVLANGKAVGWNQNPGKGWTFPIKRYKSDAS